MSVQIIDANIIKKTQDSLGKIIKKPPMTEKLLSKPPFLFLHDIVTSVIKTTGFMNGLFPEAEMNKNNVKDKEAKISFLQKVIDMISLVLGKTLSARPSKIISGNEPEKTNEMLQLLAEAINKKIDNNEYVQRVLRSDDNAIKIKKESSKHRKDEQDANGKDDQKRNISPEKKKHRSRNEGRHRDDDRNKSRDKYKHEDDGKMEDKKGRRTDKSSGELKERSKERMDGDKNGPKERHRSKKRDDEDDDGKQEKRRQSRRATEEDKINKTTEQAHESGVRDANRPGQQYSKAEILNQEVPKSPVTASRASKSDRPSTARPAPPKPRKKEEIQDEIRSNQNVIIDKPCGSDNDDDEDFITKEMVDNRWGKGHHDDVKGDHGILVKKILDTKKDLETHTNYIKKTETGHSQELVDMSRTKDKQLMSKEIEKIRSMIQDTTRNINPLGKTLDFLQESMDSMMKEINMWDEEAKHNKKLISDERNKTEATLEPLRAQFKDLEISIFEQLDKISAIKNNILTNEKKMNALLSSVIRG